ncbi:MAG: hypothetical protein WC314_20190 [Vulcanimicrobiota bacterium]
MMIAVLFISIGFFGYVALHSRILHSGQRLEEKEVIRAGTDLFEASEVARITLGYSTSLTSENYPTRASMPDLHTISTDLTDRETFFVEDVRPEFRPSLQQTMETSPTVMATPYVYSWKER